MELLNLDFVKFEPRSWYSHMSPADVLIWTRFLALHPEAFAHVAYDVPVGEGPEFDTTVNHETGGNIAKLYQLKIDAVGVAGEIIGVVEVKPRATVRAIGQVKSYARLFKRDYEPRQVVQPIIVTDSLMPEMEFLCTEEGVKLIVV